MKRAFVTEIVVIVSVALFAIILFVALQPQRDQEWEQTRWDVKGIVSDLLGYCDMYKRFPPAMTKSPDGKPLSSWRFKNAAFLLCDQVQGDYYGQVPHTDKRWNDVENQRYVSGPYREYMGGPLSYIDQSRPGNKARFVAVQGPGTAFDEAKPCSCGDVPSSMVLVVETRGATVHWMEPGGDLDIRTMPHQIGTVGGIGPAAEGRNEFFVGFVDGQVRLLRAQMPFEELEKFLTIADAGKHSREAALGPYSVRVWK